MCSVQCVMFSVAIPACPRYLPSYRPIQLMHAKYLPYCVVYNARMNTNIEIIYDFLRSTPNCNRGKLFLCKFVVILASTFESQDSLSSTDDEVKTKLNVTYRIRGHNHLKDTPIVSQNNISQPNHSSIIPGAPPARV